MDLIEGRTLDDDYRDRQDDSANKIESHLRSHPDLIRRRKLLIPIHTLSFAPAVSEAMMPDDDDYPLANDRTLIGLLRCLRWDHHSPVVHQYALSAIEGTSTIRKNTTPRSIDKPDSRGEKLQHLENSIATLDAEQNKAVIETVDGMQRLRGLAGSGKTIVLALKAAYLHARHPDWRIAVTFNTRSLKDHFRRLIERACLNHMGEEPDSRLAQAVHPHCLGSPGRC